MNRVRTGGRTGSLLGSVLRIRALRDVFEKKPSSGPNIDVLDGIRGLAVLIVVASHSEAFGLRDQGGVGVWLFFSLSAFLLTLPFVADPARAYRLGPLRHYFTRRLRRILPAYYFVIVTTFLFEDANFLFLWKHLAFLRGDGIWWTIPQEMLFYAVLPVLAALHTLLFFRSTLATALGLGVIALLANFTLTPAVFAMDGNGKQLPFHLGLFTTGMAACYAYHVPALERLVRRPLVNRILGALGLVLVALLFLTAPHYHETWLAKLPLIGGLRPPLAWHHPGALGAMCALLIYITLVCEGRLVQRIIACFPLRALGIVSFGLYLVHLVVIDKLKALGVAPGNELFGLALAIAYVLACALYGLVERPFLRSGAPP